MIEQVLILKDLSFFLYGLYSQNDLKIYIIQWPYYFLVETTNEDMIKLKSIFISPSYLK